MSEQNAVAMRKNTVATLPNSGEIMESVIIRGDLSKLSPEERSRYYMEVCKSVGLNPLTKPFEYITLNSKLTLYALRTCTDQLRSIYKVSVVELTESERDGVFIVTAKVQNGEGRTDMAKGAVTINGLKGDALANALMKCETKAKRRATLSICGLGFLDESEIETIPAASIEQPRRTRAEISEAAAFKRAEHKRVQDDVNQITSFTELDRYKREVLTPEFMGRLGTGQYAIEEMVAGREAELLQQQTDAPVDDVSEFLLRKSQPAEVPLEAEIDTPTPGQDITFTECKEWLQGAKTLADLTKRAENEGYQTGAKELTVHQRNQLRSLYRDLMDKLNPLAGG